MSKYPLMYPSTTKGLVLIEDMATPHLLNAWRKLQKEAVEEAEESPLLEYMMLELQSRGCTYNEETGRWDLPPAPPAQEAKQ